MPQVRYGTGSQRRYTRRRVLVGSLVSGAGLVGAGACSSNAAVVVPTSAALAPAAASPPSSAIAASPTAQQSQPKYGGIISWVQNADASHLDVHLTSSIPLMQYGPGLTFSKLLKFDASPQRKGDNQIVGELAESWEQPDDTTVIFKLRPGVKFHNVAPVNGRELVAEDVVYSYNRQIGAKVNASALSSLDTFTEVDKYTLRFTLKKPDADFFPSHAIGYNVIIPKESVEVHGDLKEGPLIGTGAWIHESWERNQRSSGRRNPDYFVKGVPYADRLEFLRIQDTATQLAAFRSGQTFNAPGGVVRKDLEALKKDNPGIILKTISNLGGGLQMAFNVTRPPFNDKRVRQAASKALDRQAIIDGVYDGDGFLTIGIDLPGKDWEIPQDQLKNIYKRDVEGAKKLLADAGFANGVDGEITYLNILQPWATAAEQAQAQLSEAGIRMTLKPADAAQIGDIVIAKGDFQAYFGTMFPGSSPNSYLYGQFHSSRQTTWTAFRDPAFDDLIDRQAVQRNEAERRKLLTQIQQFLINSSHQMGMLTFLTYVAYQPSARDVYTGTRFPQNDPYHWMWIDK